MVKDGQKIKCPKCGIFIDDVLAQQIETEVKTELEEKQKIKEAELDKQKKELQEKEAQLTEALKSNEIEFNKKLADKINSEKVTLWKRAIIEADNRKAGEMKMLEEQLKEKDKKISEISAESLKLRIDRQKLETDKNDFEIEKTKQIEASRKQIEEEAFNRATMQTEKDIVLLRKRLEDKEQEKESEKKILQEELDEKNKKIQEIKEVEINLRKEKNKLEESKKDFELEKQRQLDEERTKIKNEASQKAAEEQQYIIAQLKKQLTDATKAKDELARKLEQGSQQTQGEVLELEFEELLKREFPLDGIEAVRKGIHGVDVIQKVCDRSGRSCGQIAWELKHTKSWSESYIQKLKDDQVSAKADLAVIVSAILPVDVRGFAFRDNVFICDIKFAINLACLLRYDLAKVAESKRALVGKEEKKDRVYAYVNGVEFKQRIQTIAEAFIDMKTDLDKEKRAFQAIWAKREKQIERVIDNTFGVYGDLKGLTGGTIQEVKMLELASSDEEKTA